MVNITYCKIKHLYVFNLITIKLYCINQMFYGRGHYILLLYDVYKRQRNSHFNKLTS